MVNFHFLKKFASKSRTPIAPFVILKFFQNSEITKLVTLGKHVPKGDLCQSDDPEINSR